jgi:hypothetical protein
MLNGYIPPYLLRTQSLPVAVNDRWESRLVDISDVVP